MTLGRKQNCGKPVNTCESRQLCLLGWPHRLSSKASSATLSLCDLGKAAFLSLSFFLSKMRRNSLPPLKGFLWRLQVIMSLRHTPSAHDGGWWWFSLLLPGTWFKDPEFFIRRRVQKRWPDSNVGWSLLCNITAAQPKSNLRHHSGLSPGKRCQLRCTLRFTRKLGETLFDQSSSSCSLILKMWHTGGSFLYQRAGAWLPAAHFTGEVRSHTEWQYQSKWLD